eukprot:CAMPEP_0119120358 /NCGR_PEP_ID=MMETSP1310-20130426/1428_1 /TAXON_ID=464262 /ORGANISM="Genus nov. species nov., Strain RCC2339" /LENGTH=1268 /DNA_ID=CAMNT_0007109829 /DNA_START=30 /DNA_END=3836 /DNA_ORIENTATION=-
MEVSAVRDEHARRSSKEVGQKKVVKNLSGNVRFARNKSLVKTPGVLDMRGTGSAPDVSKSSVSKRGDRAVSSRRPSYKRTSLAMGPKFLEFFQGGKGKDEKTFGADPMEGGDGENEESDILSRIQNNAECAAASAEFKALTTPRHRITNLSVSQIAYAPPVRNHHDRMSRIQKITSYPSPRLVRTISQRSTLASGQVGKAVERSLLRVTRFHSCPDIIQSAVIHGSFATTLEDKALEKGLTNFVLTHNLGQAGDLKLHGGVEFKIRGGSREKLLEATFALFYQDWLYIHRFLLCYRYFFDSPQDLWARYIREYEYVPSVVSSAEERATYVKWHGKFKSRILSIIQYWIQNFSQTDFDEKMVEVVSGYMERVSHTEAEPASLRDTARAIRKKLRTAQERGEISCQLRGYSHHKGMVTLMAGSIRKWEGGASSTSCMSSRSAEGSSRSAFPGIPLRELGNTASESRLHSSKTPPPHATDRRKSTPVSLPVGQPVPKRRRLRRLKVAEVRYLEETLGPDTTGPRPSAKKTFQNLVKALPESTATVDDVEFWLKQRWRAESRGKSAGGERSSSQALLDPGAVTDVESTRRKSAAREEGNETDPGENRKRRLPKKSSKGRIKGKTPADGPHGGSGDRKKSTGKKVSRDGRHRRTKKPPTGKCDEKASRTIRSGATPEQRSGPAAQGPEEAAVGDRTSTGEKKENVRTEATGKERAGRVMDAGRRNGGKATTPTPAAARTSQGKDSSDNDDDILRRSRTWSVQQAEAITNALPVASTNSLLPSCPSSAPAAHPRAPPREGQATTPTLPPKISSAPPPGLQLARSTGTIASPPNSSGRKLTTPRSRSPADGEQGFAKRQYRRSIHVSDKISKKLSVITQKSSHKDFSYFLSESSLSRPLGLRMLHMLYAEHLTDPVDFDEFELLAREMADFGLLFNVYSGVSLERVAERSGGLRASERRASESSGRNSHVKEIDKLLSSAQGDDVGTQYCICLNSHSSVSLGVLPSSPAEGDDLDIMTLDLRMLAEQLTLLELRMFRAIPLSELIGQRWAKGNGSKDAPHVTRLVRFFNSLSKWVASSVVLEMNLAHRRSLVLRFIELSHKLMKQRNFNSMFAVACGLELIHVSRLRNTWKGVAANVKQYNKFHKVLEYCKPEANYPAYRCALREAAINPSEFFLPYLGLFLRDLTLAEEGNPAEMESGEINWERYEVISEILRQVQLYQKRTTEIAENPVYQDFLARGICYIDADGELYRLSLEREARYQRVRSSVGTLGNAES